MENYQIDRKRIGKKTVTVDAENIHISNVLLLHFLSLMTADTPISDEESED